MRGRSAGGIRRVAALALGAVALLVMLPGCAPVYDSEPILGPLDTSDPRVALGERVFAANCYACHPNASTGIGLSMLNKPLPGWVVRAQVRYGFGQMPAFSKEEIDDAELDAIVAYIGALRDRLEEARVSAGGSESRR